MSVARPPPHQKQPGSVCSFKFSNSVGSYSTAQGCCRKQAWEKLVGILHETGSKELVVVCHGIHSSKERIPMVNIAAVLENDGISAFRFDFAGNGESEGFFRYGHYRREADDIRAVVQYFRGKDYVVTAVVGHSKGGNAVILYAAKYSDVRAVVNISGRFDLERGMEGRLGKDFQQRIKQDGFIDVKNRRGTFQYRVTEESLIERLTTDMRAACQSINQNCRVLTVHGSNDKIVPFEDAFEFDKIIPNHKVSIVEGADHEYTLHQNELASIVLDFIKEDFHQDMDLSKQSPSSTRADKSLDSRL